MPRTVTIILLLALAGALEAQGRPSFAGTWTRQPDSADARPPAATTGNAPFRRGDAGTGWGTPLTITQTAESLVVSYVHFAAYDLQPPLRFAYALDGSTTTLDVMIGHSATRQASRAAWYGDTLVIVTRQAAPAAVGGDSVEVRRALRIEAPDRLVLEVVRADVPAVRAIYLRR